MIAVRIYMREGYMRSKLRSLFSEYSDDIDIKDYREDKNDFSTNIWLECEKDNIDRFLDKFVEIYYTIYNRDKELIIKIFENCKLFY